MKIELKYPYNIQSRDLSIFDAEKIYNSKLSKVKSFKRVFVSHEGLVLKNFFLYKRSAYNLSGRRDINFYFPYWREVLEKYVVCRYGKSLKSVDFLNENYSIIHTKWFNYAFWMNDSIYRCIILEEKFDKNEFILLVPRSIYEIPFVRETLDIFEFRVQILETDIHCFISNLILPQTRKYTSSFHPKAIQSIKNRLLPIALERTKIIRFPEKIYLSRKKREVRSLVNEDEVENFLLESGFTILSFEDLSVWDQIAYMQHADWFISNHGAGFTNCIFMKEGANVLEFLEYDFAHYGNPLPHWKLASSSQLKYHYLLGVSSETKFIKHVKNIFTSSSKRMSLVNRKIRIDIDELKKIINE